MELGGSPVVQIRLTKAAIIGAASSWVKYFRINEVHNWMASAHGLSYNLQSNKELLDVHRRTMQIIDADVIHRWHHNTKAIAIISWKRLCSLRPPSQSKI